MKRKMITLTQFLNILLLSISPLMIIQFLIGGFVFLERLQAHKRLVGDIGREGIAARATVSSLYEEEERAYLSFTNQKEKECFGTLDISYYDDETRATLESGQEVDILYVLPCRSDVVLAGAFDQVKAYNRHLIEPLFIMGIAWAVLVFHPDFLYLGYVDFDQIMKLTPP
jgi:hypothetical protein